MQRDSSLQQHAEFHAQDAAGHKLNTLCSVLSRWKATGTCCRRRSLKLADWLASLDKWRTPRTVSSGVVTSQTTHAAFAITPSWCLDPSLDSVNMLRLFGNFWVYFRILKPHFLKEESVQYWILRHTSRVISNPVAVLLTPLSNMRDLPLRNFRPMSYYLSDTRVVKI